MFFKNSKGQPSLTASAFILGFIIVNFKFLVSGITFLGVTFGVVTGVDYGTAITALGAIYVLRRKWDDETDSK